MIEKLKSNENIIYCEGMYMFRGTCRIVPTNPKFPEQTITGDWLYKTEYNCFYCKGSSYPASIVVIEHVNAISE